MARDASDATPVIETSSKSAMLHMISFETAEQLRDVLFAGTIKLIFIGLNIGLLVLLRDHDRPVRLSLSKLFPRSLNMIEKSLQIVFGAQVLDRHGRLIPDEDGYM